MCYCFPTVDRTHGMETRHVTKFLTHKQYGTNHWVYVFTLKA